jgi:amidophosphoribosyltransferase
MVRISRSGIESIRFSPPKPHQYCIFEHVYFSRPDSIIFGRSVTNSREMLGRLLAQEHPVEADMVVPIPDSGVPAAIGYSLESKIPFRMGLIRNHYIGRTFIEPSQAIRNFGVKLKLNPVRELVAGKRVVLVDDSIVRGTTSRKLVRMMREAGAKEVHMRISCPPTISPCYYGVDTPTKEELIASSNTPEQIRQYLGADSLGYLSLTGLKQSVNDNEGKFCTSCYTGNYPTDLVQLEVRESSANGKATEPVPVEHES